MHTTIKKFKYHSEKIKSEGGTLYIVGGAVRDFLQCKLISFKRYQHHKGAKQNDRDMD